MPLATHGVPFAGAPLRIEQNPCAAACRACALAGVVFPETGGDIGGDAGVEAAALATDDVDAPGGHIGHFLWNQNR